MSHSENKSSMRYLLASLKPFGRLAFWGPLGMLSLGLILYWQYQQHPEWLNQIVEQPESLDSYFRPRSLPVAQPDSLQPNIPNSQQPTVNQNGEGNNWAAEWKKGLTQEQLVPFSINNSTKNVKKPETTPEKTNSSLFMPLLPTVKANSQQPTAIKPYQVPQSPVAENYLKTAVDRIPTVNYPNNSYSPNGSPNQQPPYNNYNQNPAYPQNAYQQPVNPAASAYPPTQGYPNQPVTPGYPPTQGYQPPTYPNSSYARPITPTYPQTQTQPPNNPYAVPSNGGASTQPNYQVQPTIKARPAGF